jgi:hypothetical protein
MRRLFRRVGSWVVAGVVLVAVGIGQLAVAPRAASCFESGDMRVCETIGVIVLNVSGTTCLLVGMAVLAIGAVLEARHKISV